MSQTIINGEAISTEDEGLQMSSTNVVEKEPESSPATIEYPSGFKRLIIIFALLLCAFLTALDISIIATAIPQITSEFNSLADVGWYGSAFFLTVAAFQSVWGKAYKYFSLRAVFLLSIFVFEVGSLICAVAPNSPVFIVGRVVQGAGGSGSSLGSYAIASFIMPPKKVPIVVGLVGSTFSISSVLGPLLGGIFTQSSLSWRWCFYINLPIGGATMAAILIFFRTPAHAKTSNKTPLKEVFLAFDIPGLILLLSNLLCYFLVLQWAGISKSWNSATVIGLLLGWILLTVAFGANEWYQGDRALVTLRIIRVRGIGAICAVIFFLYGAYFGLVYNVPIYFQAIDGLSPMESGIRTIPLILSTSLISFVSSIAIGKFGMFQPFILAGTVLSTIGAGLIYTFSLNTSLGHVIGYQVLFGAGVGLVIQVPVIVAGALSQMEDKAVALSTVCVTQFYSAALVIAASDSIMNNILLKNLPRYTPDIDPHQVLLIGAGGIQDAFSGDDLRGVRMAFIDGLRGAWALGIAFFAVSCLCVFIAKWPGTMAQDIKSEAADENV